MTVNLKNLLLWIYFSSDTSICSVMAFPSLGYFDHDVVSYSIYFPSKSKWDTTFHCRAYNYSHTDWNCLSNHLRYFSWDDIIKLRNSVAGAEFCQSRLE